MQNKIKNWDVARLQGLGAYSGLQFGFWGVGSYGFRIRVVRALGLEFRARRIPLPGCCRKSLGWEPCPTMCCTL